MTLPAVSPRLLAGSPRSIFPARASLASPPRPGDLHRPSCRLFPSFDLLLRLEARLGDKLPGLSRALARWRTERFDAQLARMIDRARPEVLLAFSDVGSMAALPLCRRLGIKTIVSMVHGDVREEQELLERETRSSPDFMPIYLGTSTSTALSWPGCTSAGSATSRWPIACSFRRTISPKLWCGTEHPPARSA